MTRYQTLFGVEVRHPYFADGRARALRFIPDRATRNFLDRHGVVTRSDGAALQLIVAEDRLGALWAERLDDQGQPRELCYSMQSTELEAAYYTQGGAEAVYRSDGRGALAASAEPAKATPTLAGATPLGDLRLPLDRNTTSWDAWTAALGGIDVLTLRVRATIWKYLLIGDWRDCDLRLIDPQALTVFGGGMMERLPDQREAMVFRSQSTIEYREQPPQRFQLRDHASTPEKILIKRLPAAAPRGLRRETEGGASSLVSEIFVHR